MPRSLSIKLHSETQVSGRLGMSGLSITNHALSPPPSHHHMYIIHLINWLQRFYRITMSLKRYFVPHSDGKQWFITTTNNYNNSSCSFAIACDDLSKTQNSHHWPTLKHICWTCCHIHNLFVKCNNYLKLIYTVLWLLSKIILLRFIYH